MTVFMERNRSERYHFASVAQMEFADSHTLPPGGLFRTAESLQDKIPNLLLVNVWYKPEF